MEYDNRHKALLQRIIQAGVILDEDVKQLIIKLFNNNNVQLYVTTINSQLQSLYMEIKSVTCELSGDKYWMLNSTVESHVTKYQTEFSAGELKLLRNVFTLIIGSPTGCVSSIDCLNLCSSLKLEFSISHAHECLMKMVELKYLFFKDGIFFMGVRSIGELMPYFKASYEQDTFNACFLCKQVIFHGEKCTYCDVTLHLYCLANFSRVDNPLKCPNCKQPMSSDNLPDVNIAEDMMDESSMSVST